MKQFGLLAVVLFAAVKIGSAAPICIAGSLASYTALGSGGCMIGTNLLSNFTEGSFLTGATNIAPANIAVTPTGGSTNPGLSFATNVTASNGQLFDALINYTISGNNYTSDAITLAGSSSSGNGAVTYTQDFCRNGNFAGPMFVTGCPGGEGPGSPLAVLGNDTAQTSLSASSLGITDNLTFDSGGTGTAAGATASDQFQATSAVPEPSSFVLTGLALAFALTRKLRPHAKS